MSHVSDVMLSRFAILYGDPKTNDQDAFVAEYERALKACSRAVLQKAADLLIDGQTRRFWPTVGECRKATETAADQLASDRPSQFAPPPTSLRGPPTFAELERNRLADECQRRVVERYGSMDAYLMATAPGRNGGPRVAARTSPFRSLSQTSQRITGERS